VDLGASTAISSIVIWNRTDGCGSRLNDYWVFVSGTPFLPTDTPTTLQNRAGPFSSHQTTAPNPSATIVPLFQGRYVRVQLSGVNYLSLAGLRNMRPCGTPPKVRALFEPYGGEVRECRCLKTTAETAVSPS
jgi:hypothetical protein